METNPRQTSNDASVLAYESVHPQVSSLLTLWHNTIFTNVLGYMCPVGYGWTYLSLSLMFQEQEDPNKMATSWPDYYIERINSMAAVSVHSSPDLPHIDRSRKAPLMLSSATLAKAQQLSSDSEINPPLWTTESPQLDKHILTQLDISHLGKWPGLAIPYIS